MATQTQTPQQWLEQLVGDWTCEGANPADAGQEPEAVRGWESFRRLGEHWVVSSGEGTTPDGAVSSGMFTIGYDTDKQAFVGAFVCTELSSLWVFDGGTLSADGTSLTLETEAPNFLANDGGTARFREEFAFESPDRRTLTAFVQTAGGEWVQIVKSTYHRM